MIDLFNVDNNALIASIHQVITNSFLEPGNKSFGLKEISSVFQNFIKAIAMNLNVSRRTLVRRHVQKTYYKINSKHVFCRRIFVIYELPFRLPWHTCIIIRTTNEFSITAVRTLAYWITFLLRPSILIDWTFYNKNLFCWNVK